MNLVLMALTAPSGRSVGGKSESLKKILHNMDLTKFCDFFFSLLNVKPKGCCIDAFIYEIFAV